MPSLFRMKSISLCCPDYSTLSKRLCELGETIPRYTQREKPNENITAIAIDSTELKRFGRDEWHEYKHKISDNRSWRKLHVAVDERHMIQSAVLIDKFVDDANVVQELLNDINNPVTLFTADGAYDEQPVYNILLFYSPDAKVVIPPARNAIVSADSHEQRNQNLVEIKAHGRMQWQRNYRYGQRNYSEMAIQRYKRILGRAMHARDIARQKVEAIIGCSILNKMTDLGMPVSFKNC